MYAQLKKLQYKLSKLIQSLKKIKYMKRTLFLLSLILLSCSKDEGEVNNDPSNIYPPHELGTVLYSEFLSPTFSEKVEETHVNLGTEENFIHMNIVTVHTIDGVDVLAKNDDKMIFRTLTKDQLLELAQKLSAGFGYEFSLTRPDSKDVKNKIIVLNKLKKLHNSGIDIGQIYNVMNVVNVPVATIHEIIGGSLTRSGRNSSDIGTVISDIEHFGYEPSKIVETKDASSIMGLVGLFVGGLEKIPSWVEQMNPQEYVKGKDVSYINTADNNSSAYIVGYRLSKQDGANESPEAYTYKYGCGDEGMISSTFYISAEYKATHPEIKGVYMPKASVVIERTHTGATMNQELIKTFYAPDNVGTADNPISQAIGQVVGHYHDNANICNRYARLNFTLNSDTGYKKISWVENE